MADPKFKDGDKVQLNVGGPAMAVQYADTNHHGEFSGWYKCTWFAGKKHEEGRFKEETLIPYVPIKSEEDD